MTHLEDPQRPCPTQLTGPPKLLFHMDGWSWLVLQNSLNPLKRATAGLSKPSGPHTSYKVVPRPGTSSSQPRFTAWLLLGISKPSTIKSHLRLLCTSGRVALGKKQVEADLGLYHLGNPRASGPNGQLQTTSEHHHPAPAHLILHGGQKLVVSGHSQSLQLTGLGKSLPLICQQQPRSNYKRRMYSAHTKGTH